MTSPSFGYSSLVPRESSGHKGTYGTALLIGGSLGMSGAAVLAGTAALTAGAGLVRLMVPQPVQISVASSRAEYTAIPLPADRKGRISLDAKSLIHRHLTAVSAAGFGPGLGRSFALDALAADLYLTSPVPMVFDADALNALASREIFRPAEQRAVFDEIAPLYPAAPRILTPHPGEFSRLLGRRPGSFPEERLAAVREFFGNLRTLYRGTIPSVVLVLKGAGTIVSDGKRYYVNNTGNPGMGTGGSGDVLTGILTAFLAQGLSPFEAAQLAVYLHGRSGDLAAEKIGEVPLTAGDLISFFPEAVKEYCAGSQWNQ